MKHKEGRTILDFIKRFSFLIACIIWAIILVFMTCSTKASGETPVSEPEPAVAEVSVVPDLETRDIRIELPLIREYEAQRPYFQSIADTITDEEKELLAKIVYLEAGNQPMVGQRAVVEVVFNRVLDERFPDTVKEVILQDNPVQFHTVQNLKNAYPSEEQYEAIDITLQELNSVLSQDVIYFATSVANGSLYARIGDHYFCTG